MNCDGCTECCNAFPVVELNKERWEICKYADHKCKIYFKRPKSCRICECAYFQMPETNKDLRPDKCGVIFQRHNKVISGTIIGSTSSIVRKQAQSFIDEGFRVFFQRAPEKELDYDYPFIHGRFN